MSLIALGINHTTATLEVRERVAFAADQLVEALQEGCQHTGLGELAILSTCNRTEMYFAADRVAEVLELALGWLAAYHRHDPEENRQNC
jgi:glutamyl-tRNA reductase